jgi:MoxR-like ATPase
VKLQVKFRQGASHDRVEEVLGALVERGADDVSPLFPGSGDPELGALYVVETNGACRDRLLRLLERSDVVEFAEPEARRKLARSA